MKKSIAAATVLAAIALLAAPGIAYAGKPVAQLSLGTISIDCADEGGTQVSGVADLSWSGTKGRWVYLRVFKSEITKDGVRVGGTTPNQINRLENDGNQQVGTVQPNTGPGMYAYEISVQLVDRKGNPLTDVASDSRQCLIPST